MSHGRHHINYFFLSTLNPSPSNPQPFTLNPPPSTLHPQPSHFAIVSDTIGALRDDVVLAAYLAPLDPPKSSSTAAATTAAVSKSKMAPVGGGGGEYHQVVLLQRKITIVNGHDNDGNGDGQDGQSKGHSRVRGELVGVPRLVWFRSNWSCARVRILLLEV